MSEAAEAIPKRSTKQYREHATGGLPPDLAEALAALADHVGDASALAADRREAGPRFRVITIVALVLATSGVALAASSWGDFNGPTFLVAIILGGVCLLFGALLLVLDITLVPRDQPASPEATLKGWFRAIATARDGYAWAMLCPNAREKDVRVPALEPVVTTPGTHSLRTKKSFKEYVQGFARTGNKQIRNVGLKNVKVDSLEGDVARVSAELWFQSYPQWVAIVMAVGFAIFRPAVIVGVILYFAQRKRRKETVKKTLLRAPNGVWYLYDGDLMETSSAFD